MFLAWNRNQKQSKEFKDFLLFISLRLFKNLKTLLSISLDRYKPDHILFACLRNIDNYTLMELLLGNFL